MKNELDNEKNCLIDRRNLKTYFDSIITHY
jgi:hypothetical protein